MNSNEGLKYEFYTKYCFVRCCNNLPEKVQYPHRLITPYFRCQTLKEKKELVLIPLIFLSFFVISSYFIIYYYYYFFLTKPGFKQLGEKK